MAIATGSRSITFTWCPQSAESGATPIDYLLSCETDSCQTDSCRTDSCPPLNRSIIRGQSWIEYNCFTPNTTYTCYLSAMDDNGTVEPNETCTVQTLEDGRHIQLLHVYICTMFSYCLACIYMCTVCPRQADTNMCYMCTVFLRQADTNTCYVENIDHT